MSANNKTDTYHAIDTIPMTRQASNLFSSCNFPDTNMRLMSTLKI